VLALAAARCHGAFVAALMENISNDSNASNATAATATTGTSSTTEVPSTTSTAAVSCASFARDCQRCFDNNCRYCQTSPEDWNFGSSEPPSIIDYACLSRTFQCIDLKQLRPDVVSVEAIAVTSCGTLRPPKAATTLAPTTTTTKGHVETRLSSGDAWWPQEWGIVVWTAIAIVGGFLLVGCCYLGHRCRRRLQRVHVLPQSALDARIFKTKGSVKWDFGKAGVVNESDLEAAKKALEDALQTQVNGPSRCLTFWASNCLRVPVLAELDRMLSRFPSLTLSLDSDWKKADDSTLAQLAKVLMKHRDRCKFRTAGNALALPIATTTTLNSLGEGVSGHHEVDAATFEKGPKDAEIFKVSLSNLRLSSQEMIFNRQNLGDMGCSFVCGFVRPWGSRLQIARLVECGVGDLGLNCLARLLASRQPAANLKELNLSANKFGDRGMAELADALPVLDSLEKLLLERNKIGVMGAQALASRLPRSNVRELVMGTHLGGNPIGPTGVQALAMALKDALPRAAANRETRLEALALEDCQVGELGAKALAEHVSSSALMALSVARGGLVDDDATAIMMALPKSIAFLDLSGNELSDLSASIAGETLYKRSGMSINLAANHVSPTIKMLLAEEHGTRLRL